MADFLIAYNWLMDSEDPSRTFAQIADTAPAGCTGPCFAIGGINSGAWPMQFQEIAAASANHREPLIQQFYRRHFWNEWFAHLIDDNVAKRVFDLAVNGGPTAAVLCLQTAINRLLHGDSPHLNQDGIWGIAKLAAVNTAPSAALIAAFRRERVAHYRAIATANPSRAPYLHQWLARAQR